MPGLSFSSTRVQEHKQMSVITLNNLGTRKVKDCHKYHKNEGKGRH